MSSFLLAPALVRGLCDSVLNVDLCCQYDLIGAYLTLKQPAKTASSHLQGVVPLFHDLAHCTNNFFYSHIQLLFHCLYISFQSWMNTHCNKLQCSCLYKTRANCFPQTWINQDYEWGQYSYLELLPTLWSRFHTSSQQIQQLWTLFFSISQMSHGTVNVWYRSFKCTTESYLSIQLWYR